MPPQWPSGTDHDWVFIYELRYPGTWVTGLADEGRHALTSLLSLMEGGVAEAAVSLHFFEEAAIDGRARPQRPSPQDWQERAAKERAIEEQLLSQLPPDLAPEQRWAAQDQARDEARQEVTRQAWRQGKWPNSYRHTVPFLYAKAFLYAVDAVAQALATMAREPWAPETISAIATDWEHAFPTVREVRNTSHHEDERVLGRRHGNKQIELQPIDNEMIQAPGGGITVLSSLNGNRYGCTMADGHFGEVEVSSTTLEAVGTLTQRTINAYSWDGPARFVPS